MHDDRPDKGPHSNRTGGVREVMDVDPQGHIWFKADGVRGWRWCSLAQWRKWEKE